MSELLFVVTLLELYVTLLGTTNATKNPTAVPSVLEVAMIAVAVARSWTGNQREESTGGAAVSKVPASPIQQKRTCFLKNKKLA